MENYKDKITEYILNNKILNEYFAKVDIENRKDFQQYCWLIIMEYINDPVKYEKIVKLFNNNELGKYINGIISKQLISNDSKFYQIYKSKKVTYRDIVDADLHEDEENKLNHKMVVLQIITELSNIYFEDAVLYKLYRGIDPITNELTRPMTYQQIQDIIGINYQSVRNSVLKVEKILKNKIKLYE